MMDSLILKSSSKQDTVELGKRIAKTLRPGDVILLSGDLGAGKTTLVGGVAKGLGIDEPVLSPTFNIMKCYFHSPLSLYHIDAYRLEGQNIEIGLDEYIEGDGACFIEWPSYIADLIPDEHLEIEICNLGGDCREVKLSAKGPRYEQMLEELAK